MRTPRRGRLAAPTRTVHTTIRKHQTWERSRTKSDLPHQRVSSHRTAVKPIRRHARNVDPRMNGLWMLTMSATTARMVSSTMKRFGLITPWGLASSASRKATMSAPWVTIWPTVVGMGIKVGNPENARTFTNKAAHTSRGLRSRAFARAPATARFPGSASVLIKRRAPETRAERRGVRTQRFLAPGHPEIGVAS